MNTIWKRILLMDYEKVDVFLSFFKIFYNVLKVVT